MGKKCKYLTVRCFLHYRQKRYNVGKKTEDQTYGYEHRYDNGILTLTLVNLKEHEKSDTRSREETGHHSARADNARHSELSKRNRGRAVGDKSYYSAEKMAEDGYIGHTGEKILAEEEDERVDDERHYKHEERRSHGVMDSRVNYSPLAVTVIVIADLVNINILFRGLYQFQNKIYSKSNGYANYAFVSNN